MVQTIIMSFVQEAAPDIRRKLQKVEGFEAQTLSYLLELAEKVYVNRDEDIKKEAEKKQEWKANLLAAALMQGPQQGQGQKKNQCDLCFQIGHWQKSCPWNQGKGMPRGQGMLRGKGMSRGNGPRERGTYGQVIQGTYQPSGPQNQEYPRRNPQGQFVGLADMSFQV